MTDNEAFLTTLNDMYDARLIDSNNNSRTERTILLNLKI